ncbi:hypothetical protein MNV49_005292 [Pseudohyphozyma bogoriensis]|nr:hypothetical protein MNV49_005292 [Pseudohyphozyma bogoriensis]
MGSSLEALEESTTPVVSYNIGLDGCDLEQALDTSDDAKDDESKDAADTTVRPGLPSRAGSMCTPIDIAHSRKPRLERVPTHQESSQVPLSWRHSFLRPFTVRQWTAGNIFVREEHERAPSKLELFFDLVFVGVIHQLAEGAQEDQSQWAVIKFLIWFWLAWSVWQDTRSFINVSGTEDFVQRIYILAIMALLLGFSSNASGIVIECTSSAGAEFDVEPEAATEGLTQVSPGCYLQPGWRAKVQVAFTFYVVSKWLRMVFCIVYGICLPKFRRAYFLRALSLFIVSMFYGPLCFIKDPITLVLTPVVAIMVEILAPYVRSLIRKWTRKRKQQVARFRPALNLEHLDARTAGFIVLVMGEQVASLTFTATSAGLHATYLRCFYGLIIAFCFNWLYTDADSSRFFVHALRRNAFASISYANVHFPLSASLVIVSAAQTGLVSGLDDYDTAHRLRWMFGGAMAAAMIFLWFLGCLHKDLDTGSLLSRRWRLGSRLLIAVFFVTFPLASDLTKDTTYLGICALVMAAAVVFETTTKLGAVQSDEKALEALQGVAVGALRRSSDGDDYSEKHILGEEMEAVDQSAHGLTDIEKGIDDAGGVAEFPEVRAVRLGGRHISAYANTW